jgi:hypothetical protein
MVSTLGSRIILNLRGTIDKQQEWDDFDPSMLSMVKFSPIDDHHTILSARYPASQEGLQPTICDVCVSPGNPARNMSESTTTITVHSTAVQPTYLVMSCPEPANISLDC